MPHPSSSPIAGQEDDGVTLRLGLAAGAGRRDNQR